MASNFHVPPVTRLTIYFTQKLTACNALVTLLGKPMKTYIAVLIFKLRMYLRMYNCSYVQCIILLTVIAYVRT